MQPSNIITGIKHLSFKCFHLVLECVFLLALPRPWILTYVQFQLPFSVFISSLMMCKTLSSSSDILGFSSFFCKTDSMRTLSCLKITAIFTGAYKEQRRQTFTLLPKVFYTKTHTKGTTSRTLKSITIFLQTLSTCTVHWF